MTHLEFLDPLEEIIVEQFDVLDRNYADEMAKDILGTIVGQIEHENEIRYVLIDSETGQLESRSLYESLEEAQQAAERTGRCLVGTLIVESLS